MYHRLTILFQFTFLTIRFSFGQFYPVHEMNLEIQNDDNSTSEVQVQSFLLSNFITVFEFKQYLLAVERDSSKSFYKSQLPSSSTIKEEMVNEFLNNKNLQNEPMPGISWIVARNYCKWLTNELKGYDYTYDLPLVSELIAYDNLYGKSDTNELETWTLNSFDESAFEFFGKFDYQYNALNTDPRALKRKIIYGGSYHMNYSPTDKYRNFHYEYQDSSSRFVGFRIVRKIQESTRNSLNISGIEVDFSLINNQLNGIYEEKYPNGKIKVLGHFFKGQRTDIWSVWGEDGKLKIQRNYFINKSFDFVYPSANNPYKAIYQLYPEYVMEKNKQNFYPYQYIEERAVVYSKRIWRELNNKNEPELFSKVDFRNVIQELMSNEIKWYEYGENGDFKTEITNGNLDNVKSSYKNWDFSRIEIKEDFFFNLDNLKSDIRQIAISFYHSPEAKEPAYIVYFPHAREILAKTRFSSEINVIQTLDDFFFFHFYRGTILNIEERNENQKSDTLIENDLKSELEKFVVEHNLWYSHER